MTASLWREEVLTRAKELEMQLSWLAPSEEDQSTREKHLVSAIKMHLAYAQQAASSRRGWSLVTGADIQRSMYNLQSAEVSLYRLAPISFLAENMSDIVGSTAEVLSSDDPRLTELIKLGKAVSEKQGMQERDRGTVVAAISAAKKATLQAQARVRGFRNVLLLAMLLATLMVGALAMVGILAPTAVPLCQVGTDLVVVCPASSARIGPADTLIVLFAGAMGATVAAVFSLRKARGTADPYSIPIAAAFLKLPVGALTAVLGLLLIRGGFAPGFTGVSSAAQIVGWAIIFGYSQELFTHLVDRQARAVLAASPQDGELKQDRKDL
jgi:hypothetical protein